MIHKIAQILGWDETMSMAYRELNDRLPISVDPIVFSEGWSYLWKIYKQNPDFTSPETMDRVCSILREIFREKEIEPVHIHDFVSVFLKYLPSQDLEFPRWSRF